MEFKNILYAKQGPLARVTFNRPEKLNALTNELAGEVAAAFQDIASDSGVRCVVVTGAGRAFCAGADVVANRMGERATAPRPPDRLGLRIGLQQVTHSIFHCQVPTIAMVNGPAVGGGFDIACACDLRVGSEKTRFMVAYIRRGILPDIGGVWLIPRVIGLPKAMELVYTADFLEGEEAFRVGALNKLVPSEQLEAATLELATRIAKGPPIAIQLSKMQMQRAKDLDFDAALEMCRVTARIVGGTEDAVEGGRSFLERREAVFKGR
ncbi:MAG: enoyl-CoA hydratase/isomerase family protein [Chloroflexi bacterium]|nr:enoyl-CoA hydratase/isomerase family protein [Chloroflexota bacterium]